jgi:hypothetical protein
MWSSFPVATELAATGYFSVIWRLLLCPGPFVIACALGAVVDSRTKWGSRWDVVLGRIGAFSIVALGLVFIWYVTEHPRGWWS